MPGGSRTPVRCLASLFLSLPLFAAPGPCTLGPAQYDGYRILAVDIKDPIRFLTAWFLPAGWSAESRLKQELRLQAGQPFSFDALNGDTLFLNEQLRNAASGNNLRLKLTFAKGQLRDCDPDAGTLRVVYSIFTSALSTLLPSTLEEAGKEMERPSTTAASRAGGDDASDRRWTVQPLIGYNAARGLFGGMDFSFMSGNRTVRGESALSGGSRTGNLALSGTTGPRAGLWKSAEWTGAFDFSDTPAGAMRLQDSRVSGRFTAITAEKGSLHTVFRYGAALEGAMPAAGSGYGSLKAWAGLTGRPGDGAFSASWALQQADSFRQSQTNFRKHLIDLGFNRRFPLPARKAPRDSGHFEGPLSATVHKLLDLETRFNAGLIQHAEGAPATERFFGGNQLRPFVSDASWVIGDDAFIRSIPENQLGAQTTRSSIGGSRFYSGNATLAWTLWGKPMLPAELAEDTESGFLDKLNGQFDSAILAVAASLKRNDPDYIRASGGIVARAAELSDQLKVLAEKLREIPPDVLAKPSVAQAVRGIRSNIRGAGISVEKMRAGPAPQFTVLLVRSQLPGLAALLARLAADLDTAQTMALAAAIRSLARNLDETGLAIRQTWESLPSGIFEQRARQTLEPAHRALDAFLNRLNVYSVAPVGLFDVARVWPVDRGVHYGVGGGVRLSLANVNLTLAYAANPRRAPSEKAGSILFRLDVTSLF